MYDQNFLGGKGSSERCLKWGGRVGVIKGSFQKHLKTGGGFLQAKVVHSGGGFSRCHHPCPPPKEIFNHTEDRKLKRRKRKRNRRSTQNR